MLDATVLWRLQSESGGLASCRLVPLGAGCQLRLTVGDQRYLELFDRIGEVLTRASDIENMLLEQGWRECPDAEIHWDSVETHAVDCLPADRRAAPRTEPGPLHVVLEPDAQGILLNISHSGMLVQVDRDVAVGADCIVRLHWGDATLRLRGAVVRCTAAARCTPDADACYYVALAFHELAAEAAATVRVMVQLDRR
jgi:hypothetical protein